jgi:hypothetical protein
MESRMRHRGRRLVIPLAIEDTLSNPDNRLAAAGDLEARAPAATARLAGATPLPAGRRVVRGIDQLGDRPSASG